MVFCNTFESVNFELIVISLIMSDAGVPCEVVTAIDINTTANGIYAMNFPNNRLLNRSIEVYSWKLIMSFQIWKNIYLIPSFLYV